MAEGTVQININPSSGESRSIKLTLDEFTALMQGVVEHENWYRNQGGDAHSAYTKVQSGLPAGLTR